MLKRSVLIQIKCFFIEINLDKHNHNYLLFNYVNLFNIYNIYINLIE